MSVALTHQDVEYRIGEYLEHHQSTDLLDARIGTKQSVTIDVCELFKVDPDLADTLLDKPDFVKNISERKLVELTKEGVVIRFKNLPGSEVVPVRLLREKHIGKLVAIHGIIRRASEIRPRLDVGAFECRSCGAINHVKQDADDTKFQEPDQCSYDEGGCGSEKSKWRLLPEQSTFTDSQEVELSEAPEGMRGGAQPERIACFVEGDLTRNEVRISAGDRLVVVGELVAKPVKRDSTTFQMRLTVSDVEFTVHEYEELEISDEDKTRFEAEAKKGDMVARIAKCIAPSIKGMESVKQAMALQQFGGQSAKIDDGTVIRGDIHVLLVGDPGVAKTVLIRSISDIAPRTVFATGGASSKVGLTAAAVRDETTGRWTLEAGALVLADKGVAVVDEIDKMEKVDMASMHEAMEQQTVTVVKAGISATLQSRCSVLGALNPKYGRFIPEEPLFTQVDLPPALISRFDLIFALRDVPDAKRDKEIADHIGARRSRALPKPEFELDFIKKYIAYARSKVTRMTYGEGVESFITKYYTDMRGRSKDSVAITARQIEGIYRLAEASARARLSDVVDIVDARLAVNIVHEYLAKMTMDESGNFDIDRVQSSTSSSERSRIEMVMKLLKEAPRDLATLVTDSHINQENLEKVLDRLSRAGTIYKDAHGVWRIV